MAALTDAQRLQARERFLSYFSRHRNADVRNGFILTAPETDQLIAASDDFIESNKSAFNTSIPAAVRSKLAAKDKSKAFQIVSDMKWEIE